MTRETTSSLGTMSSEGLGVMIIFSSLDTMMTSSYHMVAERFNMILIDPLHGCCMRNGDYVPWGEFYASVKQEKSCDLLLTLHARSMARCIWHNKHIKSLEYQPIWMAVSTMKDIWRGHTKLEEHDLFHKKFAMKRRRCRRHWCGELPLLKMNFPQSKINRSHLAV
jgi:hypothetical protein